MQKPTDRWDFSNISTTIYWSTQLSEKFLDTYIEESLKHFVWKTLLENKKTEPLYSRILGSFSWLHFLHSLFLNHKYSLFMEVVNFFQVTKNDFMFSEYTLGDIVVWFHYFIQVGLKNISLESFIWCMIIFKKLKKNLTNLIPHSSGF